jgi:hypothetical protein
MEGGDERGAGDGWCFKPQCGTAGPYRVASGGGGTARHLYTHDIRQGAGSTLQLEPIGASSRATGRRSQRLTHCPPPPPVPAAHFTLANQNPTDCHGCDTDVARLTSEALEIY